MTSVFEKGHLVLGIMCTATSVISNTNNVYGNRYTNKLYLEILIISGAIPGTWFSDKLG